MNSVDRMSRIEELDKETQRRLQYGELDGLPEMLRQLERFAFEEVQIRTGCENPVFGCTYLQALKNMINLEKEMTNQTREELIAEMTATMETAKELGMEDMVAYYEKEIKLVAEISEEHLASYRSGCARSQQMLEKEQHRQLDLRIRNMIVEIHKDVMRCDWDNVEANTEHLEKLCREDMILLTGDKDLVAPASWFESWSVATEGMKSPNGEPDSIVKSILNTTRGDYPRHLSVRHTGETEMMRFCDYDRPRYGVGLFDHLKELNTTIVSENIPEPLFPLEEHSDSVVDPRRHILGATMYLSRANMILQLEMWQNQAAHFKLVGQSLIFAKEIDRLKSITDDEYGELEQKVNPGVVKAVIYLSEKHTQNVLAARRNATTETGSLKGIAKRAILPDELPADESGAIADINTHDKPLVGSYLTPPSHTSFHNSAAYYSSKHHPSVVEDQYKTKAFTNVIPAEHAHRMINDLNHLIEITDDNKYAASLSDEVRRLQYIADGRITKPSDVNYAWVIHSPLMQDIEDRFNKLDKGNKDE